MKLSDLPSWKRNSMLANWRRFTPAQKALFRRIAKANGDIRRKGLDGRVIKALRHFAYESYGKMWLNIHGCELWDFIKRYEKSERMKAQIKQHSK